jgi:hypothetical protein
MPLGRGARRDRLHGGVLPGEAPEHSATHKGTGTELELWHALGQLRAPDLCRPLPDQCLQRQLGLALACVQHGAAGPRWRCARSSAPTKTTTEPWCNALAARWVSRNQAPSQFYSLVRVIGSSGYRRRENC